MPIHDISAAFVVSFPATWSWYLLSYVVCLHRREWNFSLSYRGFEFGSLIVFRNAVSDDVIYVHSAFIQVCRLARPVAA